MRVSEWSAFDYAEADRIATITFSRPERLNSLTFETYGQLRDLTAELRQRSDDIQVLVIRGSGRGFCSGGDVDEIIGELVGRDTRAVYEFAQMTGACVRNLREMPQVVIAAVNGVAAGAGAVIASAADMRILSQSASFRFLFTSVGLSGGDMGICWLLPRLVGLGRATELLLLGDKVTPEQALRIGLANQVVEDDRLDQEVASLAHRLVALAPWGLAMTKEMLNRAASMDYSSAVEMEAWTQSLLMRSRDFVEFREAFREKRSPAFNGS
jgi:enoyl-CoA hydratase/carnithine racemase